MPEYGTGLPARMRDAYGHSCVIPAGYAVKPSRRVVMTAFASASPPLLMNVANPNLGSITDHTVAALSAGRDTVVWDRALTGFGVRVYPSGAKVYVVQARGPDGSRRITVGRHGVIDAAEARRRATLIIARVRAGDDPVPEVQKTESVTVATLAERYLREHVAVRCKPTTAAQYRLAIERYIVPALGTLPVTFLGRAQVADLQHSLCDRPAMANLVIATLSRMIDQARAWGRRGGDDQPVQVHPEVSNPQARTLPHRRRVPPLRIDPRRA